MTFRREICVGLLLLAASVAGAQGSRNSIEIDYNRPRKVVVGGVDVEGNQYFSAGKILQMGALRPGSQVSIPGEEITAVTRRLVNQRWFEDVAVVVEALRVTDA